MALTTSQRAILERVRSLRAGAQAVALTDEMCVYLVAVIAADLGLSAKFTEFKGKLTPFFTNTPLRNLEIKDVDFITVYERLIRLNADSDTYFVCLAALHKGRLKYETILRTQPLPTVEQVGPRGLLQYGSLSPGALTSLLFWRKWFYDIDNRAAQETGYIFEPIIANAIGGTPAPAKKSPIKRLSDNRKGRQVDCIREKKAYEIKLRVTIAASGQGRWKEELDFPIDCKSSGYAPVLVVLDSTPNDKLTQLEKSFKAQDGEVYIGAAAWEHLEGLAGETMSKFLETYVRNPLKDLLNEVPKQLPKLTAEMEGKSIKISVGGESVTIHRTPKPETALDDDEMPDDVTDQLPES
jgi:hypothetical protein